MEKQELESKQKAIAAGIVSAVYAFVMQLTQSLSLVPNHPEIQVNASIFVPAIASILFGKLIGATGAAGGQFVNSTGSNLLATSSTGGTAAAAALSTLDPSNFIRMIADFIGAWVVGSLTEKPNIEWDSFISRFGNMDTWSRLFSNVLGSIVGLGMVDSLLLSYSSALTSGANVNEGTAAFVESFFLNSAIIVIFVPITLILYEIGDIFVQVRAHAKDKSLRKLAKVSEKEDAVTIISARLTETALTENAWTPVLIKFRTNLDQEVIYKIEAVSTANYYPAFDNTKPLKKGTIWEQKFYIMPSKQKNVDFKVRITPAIQNIGDVEQKSVPETIVSIKGKSYNPNSNSATLVLFSIINSIMVGASIIWNNILAFDINSTLASFEKSWVLVASTGGLEVIIFVPLLMIMRRRWSKADSDSLTIGFGTDLSERSQKVFHKIEDNFNQFFDYFGTKLQRSVKLFLVFVTSVSVLMLGLEGYRSLVDEVYSIEFGDQLLVIGALAIVLWLGGFKGIDILKSTGILGEEKYEIQSGSVIKKFKPANDFLANAPNEVTFTITNPSENNGIRFRFLSQDTVSPPLVEMPVPPGGSAIFKTSITPISTGLRNVMVVVYPLFDEAGNYIDENAAEPYTNQYVNFKVQSETQLGISKDQESKLKKLLMVVGGLLAVIYSGGVFAEQFLGSQDVFNLLKDNAPFLLALQAPFVYAYFYVQNKSKLLKDELESIIETVNQMDNLAKEMNSKLDKSILKSSVFGKNISSVLKTTLGSVAGLSAMKELSDIVSTQIKDSLGDNFTQEITNLTDKVDLTSFVGISGQIITDNFQGDFEKIIKKETENMQLDGSTDVGSDEKKNELKENIKAKVKAEYGEKIKKQTSKKISEEMKSKSSNSLINTYKQTVTTNLKKSVSKEFKKQLKSGTIVDDIQEKVIGSLSPDIQSKITEELGNAVFNRDMLSGIAEQLDSSLGTSFISDFEETIGTAMESEMGETLKKHLHVKYEKEVMEKLQNKIKKQLTRELNKRGDQIIDDLLESKLTKVLEDKLTNTLQSTITDKLDSVVDKSIDTSVDTFLKF
jgi:hypothetical protein